MKPIYRLIAWMSCPLMAAGCTSSFVGSAPVQTSDIVAVAQAENEHDGVTLVGDWAVPVGLQPIKAEGVSLASGLNGTGSNPGPSPQRDMLVGEMKSHDVRNIEALLDSPNNSLVEVFAFIPAGAQKGDRIDAFVRVDRRSQTTSLEDGWLLPTRLRELAMLGGDLHEGHVLALAQGSILVDSLVDTGDEVLQTRGRILRGCMVTESRAIGLHLRTSAMSARNSAMIGAAVNARFRVVQGAEQQGAANPENDKYIELAIPPQYKHNISRFVRVVQSIALGEAPLERAARIDRLRGELNNPATAATAALHLEAIGIEAKQPLSEALGNSDPLVSFYAAEALAYLDDAAAAPVLCECARREPAFRWHAMTALSTMSDLAAREALISLLDEDSAETRYGAFRSLAARDSHDPLVSARVFGEAYYYHQVPSNAPPMIHVSRLRRPEVVVFGENPQLVTPLALLVGHEVTIKSIGDNRLRLSRFAASEEDKQVECEANLADLLRTLGEMKVSYAQTVKLLEQASLKGYIEARLVFDAQPTPGRTYRGNRETEADGNTTAPELPLPDLFQATPGESSEASEEDAETPSEPWEDDSLTAADAAADPPPSRGLLGRIIGSSDTE